MNILYINHYAGGPQWGMEFRPYYLAREWVRLGHQVTMVCGSIGGGNTGLDGPFVNGQRRGWVDGIDVIELDLAYSNHDGLFKRALTFLKFAWRSVLLARSC